MKLSSDAEVVDTLIEKPVCFSFGHRQFSIKPFSLGKIQILYSLLKQVGLDNVDTGENPSVFSLIAKAKKERERCIKIIAYATLQGDECLDTSKVKKREKELRRLKTTDIATLLYATLSSGNSFDKVCKVYNLNEEKKEFEKAISLKSESNGVNFGAKSPWGAIVDFACERYGWTMHYVVWGISYSNLLLLILDHPKTLYLTKEEINKGHINKDRETIEAKDKESLINYIKSQNWK